jgi:hypothetical protein
MCERVAKDGIFAERRRVGLSCRAGSQCERKHPSIFASSPAKGSEYVSCRRLPRRADNASMKVRALLCVLCMLCAACAPSLDWREVTPSGSGAAALFPCKPKDHSRTVQLGLASVSMALHACNAGGATYALAHADLGNPEFVGPALAAWRTSTAANLGASAPKEDGALQVQGMTPNPHAVRIRIAGQLPDGAPMQAVAAFFVKGTRVFQITVVGPKLDSDALETYFSSVKLY